MPSAIVAPAATSARRDLDGDRAPQRLHVGRAGPRLHTHELDLRARAAQRDPDAARQAAAADGHHHAREVRHVLEQLEPERALAGDHVEVVEGMHERRTRLVRALRGQRERLLDRCAPQAHLRPSRSTAATFETAASRGMNTSQPTPATRAARRPHAPWLPALAVTRPGARALAERGHLVQRAAQLERAGALQALGLQRDRRAGELGELLAGDRRRTHRDA